jgi:heme exporter protein D
MYFESFSAAIDMAGHGGYVWSAYAISLVVIGYLLIAPRLRGQRLQRQIAGELRRDSSAKSHDSADSGEAVRRES